MIAMARRPLFVLALLLGLALACKEDEPTPLELCKMDGAGGCCEDAECDGDAICDFDYVCSPAPDGGVQCGEGSGDRLCHALCDAPSEGMACPGGGTCTRVERFQGGDNGQEAWACFTP